MDALFTLPVGPALLEMALDPIDQASRSDTITRRLQQAIALGLFEDGAPLPSEAELAAQLQVSNVTLRASLADLRREGLIETRRGRGGGSFIRAEAAHNQSVLTKQLLTFDVDSIRDVRDLQVGVSGRAAYLAASRAKGQEFERLQRVASALSSATTSGTRVKCDFRFHAELAATAHSAKLTRAEMVFMSELAPFFWMRGLELHDVDRVCSAHLDIADAVRRRKPDEARVLAETHVDETLSSLIELRMLLGRRRGQLL